MGRRSRVLALIISALVVSTGLVGCGGSKDDGKETITVWSHLSTKEVTKVEKLAKEWGDKNDINVKVVEDQGEMQVFKEAANSSSGPDIYYGIANDNLGTFQKADLLAEVPSEIVKKDDYVSQNVLDAVTIDGKMYALPIAEEAIALYYNKDKVSEAPKTMEEAVEIGKQKGFMFNAGDLYITYGIITANGGYVFKNNNGTLDVNDVGFNTEGTVKGLQFIQDCVQKDGLMTADVTDDIAKSKFVNGETAFYISGPWNVKDVKDAGINLGLCKLPTLNGNKISPFLGVQSAFVNKNSKKQDKSWELIKYLNENNTDIIINEGNRIPVLKSAQQEASFKDNKDIQVFAQSAEDATPMPNIPEVQAMWEPGKNNLKLLISGQIDAATAAKNIYDQTVSGITQIK